MGLPRAMLTGQKATSTKRCIKTWGSGPYGWSLCLGQKAPSAKRCIKTWLAGHDGEGLAGSESTERQKVH